MARYTKQTKTSDDPFGGEPISKGMSSGNSSPTQGNSAATNSRTMRAKEHGNDQHSSSSRKDSWGMDDMPQNYKSDNTQKPQSITPTSKDGSRPGLESKGSDVWGTGQSKRAPSKTDLGHEKSVLSSTTVGREESMGKGFSGRRSGGKSGEFFDKRNK